MQGLVTRAVVHPEHELFSTFFWYQISNCVYGFLCLYFLEMNLVCLLHNLRQIKLQVLTMIIDMMAPFAGTTS
jgi:hypothetical protein